MTSIKDCRRRAGFPVELHTGVARHPEAEDGDEHGQLGHHADVAGVGEGDDEADALPEPVVRERRLLLIREEDSVERCSRIPVAKNQ